MRAVTTLMPIIAAAALGQAALADEPTVSTEQGAQYGAYLIGAEGKPLYMFTTDTQGGEGTEPEISCTSEECLAAWPLVPVEGEPTAGGEADESMLGTMSYEGQTVATYNGWPLYTFAKDSAGEPPQGQDVHSFGGEWYLIGPDGEKVEAE